MSDGNPKRRWLLIGSLALNLFLIGFLAVGFLHHHDDDHRWRDPFRQMIHFMRDRGPEERFLHHLSNADEAVMRRLKAEHGAALTEAWSESRAAREEIRSLMRDGVRDPARLQAAMARARETRMAAFLVMDALMLDIAEQLSDDGYTMLGGDPRKGR